MTHQHAAYERVRMPAPVHQSNWLRRFAAGFWLDFMFLIAVHAPWLMRLGRTFFLWSAWNCSRHIREVTALNARRILSPHTGTARCKQLGRATISSFFDFIYDIGRTLRMPRQRLEQEIATIEGKENYHRVRAAGKGAIIATAHMGSFELGMTAMLQVEKRIHVVFQRDNHSLFERLRGDFRRRMGIEEAAIDDGFGVWLKLRDALAANEVVAIQADRAMPGQIGVKVPFLHGHTLLPEGPAKLAAITGAPIVPVFTIRQTDGRVSCHIEEPICLNGTDEAAINDAIGRLAEVIGRYVATYPEQWLVLHRAWCEDIDAIS